MGEMSEYLINRMMDQRSSTSKPKTFQSGSGNYMWRDRSGVAISMRKMTDEHIMNAIQICKKHGNSGKMLQLKEVINERYGKSSV